MSNQFNPQRSVKPLPPPKRLDSAKSTTSIGESSFLNEARLGESEISLGQLRRLPNLPSNTSVMTTKLPSSTSTPTSLPRPQQLPKLPHQQGREDTLLDESSDSIGNISALRLFLAAEPSGGPSPPLPADFQSLVLQDMDRQIKETQDWRKDHKKDLQRQLELMERQKQLEIEAEEEKIKREADEEENKLKQRFKRFDDEFEKRSENLLAMSRRPTSKEKNLDSVLAATNDISTKIDRSEHALSRIIVI